MYNITTALHLDFLSYCKLVETYTTGLGMTAGCREVKQALFSVSRKYFHCHLVYLIVIGNDAEGKPSAVAVIVTVPGLFLAPIIAKAKPLNALR